MVYRFSSSERRCLSFATIAWDDLEMVGKEEYIAFSLKTAPYGVLAFLRKLRNDFFAQVELRYSIIKIMRLYHEIRIAQASHACALSD